MNQEYLYILQSFLPEVTLTALALVLLLVDLGLPKGNCRRMLVYVAAAGCVASALMAATHWLNASQQAAPAFLQPFIDAGTFSTRQLLGHPGAAVWWLFANDQFADAFKVIFSLAAALVLLFSVRYPVDKYRVEFVALLLFAAVGMMIMANSRDLVVLFLGLELTSICLYALAAWLKNDVRSAEAGVKYLLLGSLASAFFIYGASLLFVKYGSTHIITLANSISITEPLALVGLIMLLVGFAFKVAAAPFHLWAPDVYQGAPVTVAAFLSTASKAAGFAVIIRVLAIGFPMFSGKWGMLIAVLAVVSILVGNLVAVHQNNLKRLLAYSGIAQAGYLLIGVVALALAQQNGSDPLPGVSAVLFYLFLYTFGNIGAFAVVGVIAQSTGSSEMSAFAGLRTRAPLLAFTMLLLLLSLGGIPLLAGFVGKWFLFMSGAREGAYLLVLLAAAMNVVSIYYYLLIAKQMYIKEAAVEALPIRTGFPAACGFAVVLGVTIWLGVYPGPFLKLAETTARSLFGM